MYNRYVSQGDGSFQRSSMPDSPRPQPRPAPPPPERRPAPPDPPEEPHRPEPCPPCSDPPKGPSEAQRFFTRLLPQNMDAGDLLMLLILLLLLNDGNGDAPPALLTLALYFLLKPEEGCGT